MRLPTLAMIAHKLGICPKIRHSDRLGVGVCEQIGRRREKNPGSRPEPQLKPRRKALLMGILTGVSVVKRGFSQLKDCDSP